MSSDRTFAWTLLAVGAVAAGLGLASAVQGPRLDALEVNPAAVVERDGQRLALRANQPVREIAAADVEVVPSVDFEVRTEGAAVILTFDRMLSYATDYEVSVRATGAYSGAEGDLRAVFTTPDPGVTSLVRDERGDRIARQAVRDASDYEVIAEGLKVQEYAPLREGIAVVALRDGDRPELGLVARAGAGFEPLAGQGLGAIRQLRSLPSLGLIGYVVDQADAAGTERRDALLVQDVSGARPAPPVAAVDENGEPLRVAEWRFAGGDGAVQLVTTDGELVRFDPWRGESEPVPEGGQLPDPLRSGATGVEVVDGRAVLRDGADERALGPALGESERLEELCLSPNREFLSIERSDREGRSTLAIVRLVDGLTVREAVGGMSGWCRS